MYGTRYGGQPSAADLAKAAVSDGVGPHDHDGFGPHQHGEPKFTDAEVAWLESAGYHVDRHHGQVLHEGGRPVPPHCWDKLRQAHKDGELPASPGQLGKMISGQVGQSVSGPGEAGPVVQHLDLRGG